MQIGSIYQLKYIRVINEKVIYRKKYEEGKRGTDFVLHKILQLSIKMKKTKLQLIELENINIYVRNY